VEFEETCSFMAAHRIQDRAASCYSDAAFATKVGKSIKHLYLQDIMLRRNWQRNSERGRGLDLADVKLEQASRTFRIIGYPRDGDRTFPSIRNTPSERSFGS